MNEKDIDITNVNPLPYYTNRGGNSTPPSAGGHYGSGSDPLEGARPLPYYTGIGNGSDSLEGARPLPYYTGRGSGSSPQPPSAGGHYGGSGSGPSPQPPSAGGHYGGSGSGPSPQPPSAGGHYGGSGSGPSPQPPSAGGHYGGGHAPGEEPINPQPVNPGQVELPGQGGIKPPSAGGHSGYGNGPEPFNPQGPFYGHGGGHAPGEEPINPPPVDPGPAEIPGHEGFTPVSGTGTGTGSNTSFRVDDFMSVVNGAISSFQAACEVYPKIAATCSSISSLVRSEDSGIADTVAKVTELSNSLKTKTDSIINQMNSWGKQFANTSEETEEHLQSDLNEFNDDFSTIMNDLNNITVVPTTSGRGN